MAEVNGQGRFSEHEVEVLKSADTARHFKQMVEMRGWELFLELKDERITQVKEQLINATNLDKDALWAAQIRVKGIIDFVNKLFSEVAIQVENLDPIILQQILATDPSEYDGEFNLQEIPEV